MRRVLPLHWHEWERSGFWTCRMRQVPFANTGVEIMCSSQVRSVCQSGFLAIVLFLFATPSPVWAQFSGGDGTAGDPWQIATAAELDQLRSYLGPDHADKHFVLIADLDLWAYSNGEGWTPIGSSGTDQLFSASLDGAGHVIRNLFLDRPASQYQGLFGYLLDAKIRDLGIENASVHGSNFSGLLAGYAVDSTLEGLNVAGELTGTGSSTGGLVGALSGGSVHHSQASVIVQGLGSNTGGLVGDVGSAAVLAQNYSLGSVQGETYTGGLVGHLSGTVADSYNRAAVSGDSDVGGLVGHMVGSSSRIDRAYSTGPVNGTGDNIGGLLGWLASGTASDSYWDTETSEQATSAGGAGVSGKTTAEMQQRSTYAFWSFHSLWQIDEDNAYPRFQNLGVHAGPQAVALNDLDGSGLVGDPWIITNADELNAMRQALDGHFRLGNDIDLSATVIWDAGRGWNPIGSSGSGQQFSGGLDGAGHVIRNLFLDRPASQYQGLFGYLFNASVNDLGIESANVRGSTYSGLVTGFAINSALENLSVSGELTGTGSSTGGLVGSMSGGSMRFSQASIKVRGLGPNTGGLAGDAGVSAVLAQNFSLGSVQGANLTGGLVGHLLTAMVDSYSHAAVSGSSDVGGLVGSIIGNTSRIDRAYSSGAVSGTGSNIGGLLGRLQSGSVADSYWDTQTSGQSSSAGFGGVSGKTTAQMRQRATYAYWNFHSLWQIDEDNGYPVFQDLGVHTGPQAVELDDLDGSGQVDDPWIITNADELNAMRQALDGHFRLGNDIDLSATVIWDAGRGWTPIGSSGTNLQFSGSLDGAGHVIRNLFVDRPRSNEQGLFGVLNSATVRDLGIENAMVRGSTYSGLLIGRAINSTLENLSVTGELTGTGNGAGGLVGALLASSLRHSQASVRVRGLSFRNGGLVGEASSFTPTVMAQNFSRGSVQGAGFTGGLIGFLRGTMADSFSHAAVSGGSDVGGLVGYIVGESSRIDRSYSSGPVNGTGDNIGGLLGRQADSTVVADSYWDTETSGQASSAGGAGASGKTSAEMRQRATYAFWNFHSLWQIDEENAYPAFQDLGVHAGPQVVDLDDLDGSGQVGDPWILTNADELNAMRQALDGHFRLGNDIDLSATVTWDAGRGWTAIGSTGGGLQFSGSLDGAGYVIRNLFLDRPASQYQGLFGHLFNATVRDLDIENATVHGDTHSGLLAGFASGSTLEDLGVAGELTGTGSSTGGLVGALSDSGLHHSQASVHVRGLGSYTGGLVGEAGSLAVLTQNFSLGSVQGASFTGGLAGLLSGTVADSYSRAAVSGTNDVGGLVGYMIGSSNRIDRAYSSGAVNSTGSNIGGLLGRLESGTVADSYWDTQTSEQATSAGGAGVNGKTTVEMKQQATFVDWNFGTPPISWSIVEEVTYPNLEQTARSLALDLSRRLHGRAASAGHIFEVRANTAWTAIANDAWIEVTGSTGGVAGAEDGTVTYAIEANPGPGSRSGSITVSDGTGIERIFRVDQDGESLMISPPYRNLSAPASSTHSIAVQSNLDWTATSDAAWLIITDGAGGNGDGSVTYRVTENTPLTSRQGTITVAGGGLSHDHVVNQAPASPYLFTAPGFREHSAAAFSGQPIEVVANVDWTAGSDSAWLTIDSGAGGSGDGSISYSLDANPTDRSRSGIIRVGDGQRLLSTRIVQAPARRVSGVILGTPGQITLLNNQTDDLVLYEDGGFSFATLLPDGESYAVSVADDLPESVCQVFNGSGTISGTNVYNILVFCLADELFHDRFKQ
jgi:hypothetical protein